MENWRPDGKVGGNQTGFWGAISFPSVSVKDRSLLIPLVMLNACLTFSWPNKVPFDREASGIIQAGIYTGAHTGVEEGAMETRRVSPRSCSIDSRQPVGLRVLRLQFVPRRSPE
jgi:hypothetical protein